MRQNPPVRICGGPGSATTLVYPTSHRHDLFSVLGTVSEFRSRASILNRDDFAAWLSENSEHLRDRVSSWIPEELGRSDRRILLAELTEVCFRHQHIATPPLARSNQTA